MTTKIEQAFDNTNSDYMKKSLEQRNPGPNSAGSTFHTQTSFEDLKSANWKPANDPAIQSPGEGFVAPISGMLGIAKLDELPQTARVLLRPAHKGQAKIREGEFAGQVPAEVAANLTDDQRTQVDFTTLIIGPDRENPEKTVVWTFFPGPATFKFKEIPFTQLQEKFGETGDSISITVKDAIALGFQYCKHASDV